MPLTLILPRGINDTCYDRERVCVCYHPIYSGRQTTCGRTSRGHTGSRKRSHRIKEGHTGFINLPSAVLALIFIARRIQPSLSLVDREVEFRVPTNLLFFTCWAHRALYIYSYIYIYLFFEEKSQFVESDYLYRGYT